MQYAVLACRLIFGAWFVFNGLLYWFADHMPMGHHPVPIQLMEALLVSDLLLIVKIIEVATGLMLLANVFTPLALVVAFPVTLVIAYNDLVLEWPLTRPLIGGGLTLLIHVFLLFAYLRFYAPMLVFRAQPGPPIVK
ncbi:DoxX family membrane protein [Hyphococcus luteus]|uniref:DoxX family protein n=1 Tax=Hyphococcus luteus TaxID=2058213 RepID=A0A2S7K516_9PROT|nr:DoxX family membrane protein [Marinicaulis flavus]PQA87607.1 hypothetical protein CW354_11035 [Marinicaulis flavus]